MGDTLPVCFAAFRPTLEAFVGRRYGNAEIMATFGPSEEGIMQRLVPDRWEACLAAYLEAYEREHGRCTAPFPGLEGAFELLRARGAALAIVTGKGAVSAAVSLRQLGVGRYFDVVETGSPVGGIKPASIRKVLVRWGARPDEVAYVGDAAADVDAAKEAGVIALAAAWASTARADELEARRPLATFSTVADFIAWIEANVKATPGSPDQGRAI